MKILFITGNHPRHAYIARCLEQTGCLAGVIVEQRENMMPAPPSNIDESLQAIFQQHFLEREFAENDFFGAVEWPNNKINFISIDEINSKKVQDIITGIKPDLLLTYGCHKLSNETLACASGEKWNCHGGLSPWYKGTITHFWPSYMLEPQMTGMTVHELTQQLDAGDIVHQCTPELVRGDGIHQLAARAVTKLGEELPLLISLLKENNRIKKHSYKINGKLWASKDWRPEHLKVIYELYGNKIVDRYLDGQFATKKPELFRQF